MNGEETPIRYRSSRWDWISLGMTVTLLGLLLGMHSFRTGLVCDELLFLHAVDLGFPESLMAAGSSHPPLMRVIVGALGDPATTSDWLLRLPSILFSLASVFVWQRILLRFFKDEFIRFLLLPSIALNIVWLAKTFQCLPYAGLTFLASLHALAWFRLIEKCDWKNFLGYVLSAALLPWMHFYGINVLIAGQFSWLVFWMLRQVSLRQMVYANLSVFVLTCPIIPLAIFYLTHDAPYPLREIEDFASYFPFYSSLYFVMTTFSGASSLSLQLADFFPYLFLYLGCLVYLWKLFQLHQTPSTKTSESLLPSYYGVIGISFLLAGFTAGQLVSLLTGTAMWPRYMLNGAWIHLPLILFLFIWFGRLKTARAMAVACAFLAAINTPKEFGLLDAGGDYSQVIAHLESSQRKHDAFLVQDMDFWLREGNYDQLWFDRYIQKSMRLVSGPRVSRERLKFQGIPLEEIDPRIQRVWIYSHMCTEDWFQEVAFPGWKIAEYNDFGGAYPLVLLERHADDVPSVAAVE